jgi:hypothetical protein
MAEREMPSQKIVTHIPVERLSDAEGDIEAHRERFLSKEALRELLRQYPVEFVIAEVGLPLKRIGVHKCFAIWKSEVEAYLVDDPEAGFQLENFPGEYAYVASEWSGQIETPIVLLEKHH